MKTKLILFINKIDPYDGTFYVLSKSSDIFMPLECDLNTEKQPIDQVCNLFNKYISYDCNWAIISISSIYIEDDVLYITFSTLVPPSVEVKNGTKFFVISNNICENIKLRDAVLESIRKVNV